MRITSGINRELKSVAGLDVEVVPTGFSGKNGTLPVNGKFLRIQAIEGGGLAKIKVDRGIGLFRNFLLSFVHSLRFEILAFQTIFIGSQNRLALKLGKEVGNRLPELTVGQTGKVNLFFLRK